MSAAAVTEGEDRFAALLGAGRGPADPARAARERNLQLVRALAANSAKVMIADTDRVAHGCLRFNPSAGWRARFDAGAPTFAAVCALAAACPPPDETLAAGIVVSEHVRWLVDLAVQDPTVQLLRAGSGMPALDTGVPLAVADANGLRNIAVNIRPPSAFNWQGGRWELDRDPGRAFFAEGRVRRTWALFARGRVWRAWAPDTPGCWATPVNIQPDAPAAAYRC